jgi:hypothetical protein
MTNEELMNLPDVSYEMGYIETYDNNMKKIFIPTMNTNPSALFQKEDDCSFVDDDGIIWITGWINNVHVRRKLNIIY